MQFGVLCSTFPLPGKVLLEENFHQLKCFDSHLPFFFLWLYIVWFFSFILNYLLFPLTSNNRRLWIGWEVWVTFIRVLSSRASCSIGRAVKLLINQWMTCFLGSLYVFWFNDMWPKHAAESIQCHLSSILAKNVESNHADTTRQTWIVGYSARQLDCIRDGNVLKDNIQGDCSRMLKNHDN